MFLAVRSRAKRWTELAQLTPATAERTTAYAVKYIDHTRLALSAITITTLL